MNLPAQWIAKTYTELLGRGPRLVEWDRDLAWFTAHGVSPAELGEFARSMVGQQEYASLGYDGYATALTLCRALLNREPDPEEIERLARAGDGAFDMIVRSDGFAAAATLAVGPNPNTYFGLQPVQSLPTRGEGLPAMDGDELQAILDRTPAGETVWLRQRAVYRLHRPLWVRNVNLATFGTLGPRRYADMARLVCEDTFVTKESADVWEGNGAVELRGGRLASLWVDGRHCRPELPGFGRPFANVNAMPTRARDCEILHCRNSNTRGATSITAIREQDQESSSRVVIRGNLVEHYGGEHWCPDWREARWSDGINNHCADALIEDNYVIDATDVGIISFFRPHGAQSSMVRSNVVLQAGNSAYGGIAIDPFFTQEGAARFDFTGYRAENNLLIASPRVHFDIGVSVGTRAWFGERTDAAFGGQWRRNRVVGPVGVGVLVHGTFDVTVQDNVADVTHAADASPPFHAVANTAWRGWASGDLQAGDDFEADVCIGHSVMPPWHTAEKTAAAPSGA